METINGLPIIASQPTGQGRRIVLAVRADHADARTYVTASAAEGPVDHWDHGRYFTGDAGHHAYALETALQDFRARVANATV